MKALLIGTLLLLSSVTVAWADCERLLAMMITIRLEERQAARLPRLPPEQERAWTAWNAQCRDTPPWAQRLHARLHPEKPWGQGWGRALGLEAPIPSSRSTTSTTCHGGGFVGYWCTSTTHND